VIAPRIHRQAPTAELREETRKTADSLQIIPIWDGMRRSLSRDWSIADLRGGGFDAMLPKRSSTCFYQ